MLVQVGKYRFGPFELRTRTRELYKHGIRLKLRPQAFQVLVVLLEHAAEGVTREELQKRVWPSNTFVDFDHGLNTAIKELRSALSDSASEPRYIETLPKTGYRLIVPVETETAAAAPTPSEQQTVRARQPTWPWVSVLILAVAALAILIGPKEWPRLRPVPQRAALQTRKMLAVLPFENLTGVDGQEYFSDGLTEEMITQLGRLDPQRFGVIARTSVMHYKRNPASMEQIGRELGVRYVLEGSVRRDSQKVRIDAKLIEVGSQTPLWSREYDRDLTNLLSTQAEIAFEISDEIQLTLGGAKRSVRTNPAPLTPKAYQAYDLYLKGLYSWNKRTLPGFQQAVDYFRQAIAKDPGYAPAYAGLANSYTLLTGYSLAPSSRYMPQARAAALHALQLDDTLPEAHVALALVVQNYDWDWATSEKEFRRAIELNPNYATAHHWYAEHLAWRGRFPEALHESDIARSLDPLSLIIATDHAMIFYYSRQYDRAIEQFHVVQELDPKFSHAHMVAHAYIQNGQYADALAELERWFQDSGDGPAPRSVLALLYGRSGQPQKARSELTKVEADSKKEQLDPLVLVFANIGAGDKEAAIELLKKAYAQHSNSLTALKVEPVYDPLRSDPRFQELLRRVGLGE